ncbi:hypothetical protein HQ393_01720 [Chitinibacter bivalviorum]|uniref:Uncharacterized protein n=1 Tax=Chitinibacter bivalviorum TaxID=2739434 RepID=A0A7H9BF68_9NEIS|nr:hypothetical protein [Chitinibacter bivalviorum]QLG87062.1 hypothetical protein HQ393_01720 [Chitinibacter bivalviorum]
MNKETSIDFIIETVLADLEGGVDLLAADIYKLGSVSKGINTANLHQTQMGALESLFEGLAMCGMLDAGELREGIAGLAVVAAVLRARLIETAKTEQQNKGGAH